MAVSWRLAAVHVCAAQRNEKEYAERHLKCIKLLVHPNVLKVVKVKQTDTGITIATDRCYPLSATRSWCLSAFECTVDNDAPIARVLGELKWHASWGNGWRPPMSLSTAESVRKLDQWGIGALMCWVYALLSGSTDVRYLTRQDCDLQSLKRFAPGNLHGLIDQLMSPGEDVNLEEVLQMHPYFAENEAVAAMSFALEFHIQTEEQMRVFFSQLPSKLPRIPTDIACKQLLPEILKAISIQKALVPHILGSIVIICKSILVEDFKAKVYPHISRLFKENDRAIRYSLLRLMPDLDALLDENEVSEDLLDPILIGFGDTASQIRDETVKAMVYVMKKIKRRQQSNAAMLLFKCVEDSEPTIRVNAIICFAKIIPFVHQELIDKVVPQVWRVGLSDTFLKSRIAALESISASHGFFGTKQKVEVLLPLACNTLLDGDVQVRKLGMDTVYAILDSLKEQLLAGRPRAAFECIRHAGNNQQVGNQRAGSDQKSSQEAGDLWANGSKAANQWANAQPGGGQWDSGQQAGTQRTGVQQRGNRQVTSQQAGKPSASTQEPGAMWPTSAPATPTVQQHKSASPLQPMSLGSSTVHAGKFKQSNAPSSLQGKNPPGMQQLWGSSAGFQAKGQSAATSAATHKQPMHDTTDELDDFFDSFKPKK
ncbi:protein kinase, putative [Babesia caballi]|uniref:Protein kinase, putative n=1 Tax=Babesia caballi TaxID=5871 RepID=A0AAV4LTJ8_BABCB|nr:protein kinase, putative [Babesia caballi]